MSQIRKMRRQATRGQEDVTLSAKFKRHFGHKNAAGEDCMDGPGMVLTMIYNPIGDVGNLAWRPVVARLQAAADRAVAFWAAGYAERPNRPPLVTFPKLPTGPHPAGSLPAGFTVTDYDLAEWVAQLAGRLELHNADQALASGIEVNPATYRRALEGHMGTGEEGEATHIYLDLINGILFGETMPPTPQARGEEG